MIAVLLRVAASSPYVAGMIVALVLTAGAGVLLKRHDAKVEARVVAACDARELQERLAAAEAVATAHGEARKTAERELSIRDEQNRNIEQDIIALEHENDELRRRMAETDGGAVALPVDDWMRKRSTKAARAPATPR